MCPGGSSAPPFRLAVVPFRKGRQSLGSFAGGSLATVHASTSARSQYGDRRVLIDAERPFARASRACGLRSKWFRMQSQVYQFAVSLVHGLSELRYNTAAVLQTLAPHELRRRAIAPSQQGT